MTRLQEYQRRQGIRTRPLKENFAPELESHHVYGHLLSTLTKVDVIRQGSPLGPITVPLFPLRVITPAEVFSLALRLDGELDILFRQAGMQSHLWLTAPYVKTFVDKTPSDVFLNVQRISLLMDTLIGPEGFPPDYLLREAITLQDNITLVAQALGEQIVQPSTFITTQTTIQPIDLLVKSKNIARLLHLSQHRAGLFSTRDIVEIANKLTTHTDLFNQIRLVDAELSAFMRFIGITNTAHRPPLTATPSSTKILQALSTAEAQLLTILHLSSLPIAAP